MHRNMLQLNIMQQTSPWTEMTSIDDISIEVNTLLHHCLTLVSKSWIYFLEKNPEHSIASAFG